MRRVLLLGLIAALLGGVPARAATINLIAYVTFALEDADGDALDSGSYVAIIGSGDAVNDGMRTWGDGYLADSVQGDDVFIGWVRIDMPSYNETPGTFYTANQFTFDDTVVHNLYLRFFDTTEYPIDGHGIMWNTSPVTNIDANIAFGFGTMDFVGNYQTLLTNNFYIIPEPGSGSLLFVALALAGTTSVYLRLARARKRRTVRRGAPWMMLCAAAAALLVAGRTAPAQMYTPIHIGTTQPIVDEFGSNLVGDAASDPSECDLVQILWASNSVVYPPDYDGNPDPNNAPVSGGTAWIGNLTARGLVRPGFFSVSLSDGQAMNNGKVFVRVFNAPTLAEASFYGDSAVRTISYPSAAPVVNIFVDIAATTNPIDPRDFDGDELNNSWEKSYQSDPDNWDTDGDLQGDGHEIRAGTDLLDVNSVFVLSWLNGGESPDALVLWDSVPGKQYRVEYSTNYVSAAEDYKDVSPVITATGSVTETLITNGLRNAYGHYRVRLVEE